MALESAALARRLAGSFGRKAPEEAVSRIVASPAKVVASSAVIDTADKLVVRPATIDTADKLVVRSTTNDAADKASVTAAAALTPTEQAMLNQLTAAIAAVKPAALAQVPALAAGPDVAGALQKLYADAADKAVASLDPAIDEAIGKEMLASLAKTSKALPDNHPLTTYIQGIVDRTAGANPRFPYKVSVLESNDVNAFNAGGSTMIVLTGLLPTIDNEATFAGILDHEMTHGDRRHVMKKLIAQAISGSANETFAASYPIAKGEGFFAGGQAIFANLKREKDLAVFNEQNFEAMRNFVRAQEAEADAGGARGMAGAGYDPHAMSRWFQAQDQKDELASKSLAGRMQSFLNDHPDSATRFTSIEQEIKAEGLDAKATEIDAQRFLAATQAYRTPAPAPAVAKA